MMILDEHFLSHACFFFFTSIFPLALSILAMRLQNAFVIFVPNSLTGTHSLG
jgi:hypothetical protein